MTWPDTLHRLKVCYSSLNEMQGTSKHFCHNALSLLATIQILGEERDYKSKVPWPRMATTQWPLPGPLDSESRPLTIRTPCLPWRIPKVSTKNKSLMRVQLTYSVVKQVACHFLKQKVKNFSRTSKDLNQDPVSWFLEIFIPTQRKVIGNLKGGGSFKGKYEANLEIQCLGEGGGFPSTSLPQEGYGYRSDEW